MKPIKNDGTAGKNPNDIPFFKAYGGISEVRNSRYLWVAVAITGFCYGIWSEPGWWDLVYNVSPDLIGLTLSAFALIVGLAQSALRPICFKSKKPETPAAIKMGGSFVYFIFLQTLGLVLAFLMGSFWQTPIPRDLMHLEPLFCNYRNWFWAFSFFVFVYGILLVFAAAEWIYMFITVISDFEQTTGQTEDKPSPDPPKRSRNPKGR